MKVRQAMQTVLSAAFLLTCLAETAKQQPAFLRPSMLPTASPSGPTRQPAESPTPFPSLNWHDDAGQETKTSKTINVAAVAEAVVGGIVALAVVMSCCCYRQRIKESIAACSSALYKGICGSSEQEQTQNGRALRSPLTDPESKNDDAISGQNPMFPR